MRIKNALPDLFVGFLESINKHVCFTFISCSDKKHCFTFRDLYFFIIVNLPVLNCELLNNCIKNLILKIFCFEIPEFPLSE